MITKIKVIIFPRKNDIIVYFDVGYYNISRLCKSYLNLALIDGKANYL